MTVEAEDRVEQESGAAGGEMRLVGHLRELRTRLVRSVLAVLVGTVVAWTSYDRVFALVQAPLQPVVDEARRHGATVTLAVSGVTDAFTLQLKVSLVVGVLLAVPVWLYQLWRFLAPGLHGEERRWAYVFALVATPLFLGGAALGFAVLPSMLGVLLGFTPTQVANIIDVGAYLSLVTQVVLFFGVGFLVPLVPVMLNLAGLLTGRRLLGWWRALIIAVLVFAAVATPTGDPVTMSLVALPLLALVALAATVMVLNDLRRARRAPSRRSP